MKRTLISLAFIALIQIVVKSQTVNDTVLIKHTILNYALGWYEGKADSIQKAMYSDFGKRKISVDENGKTKISPNTAMSMYQKTQKRSSKPMSHEDAVKKIKDMGIFAIYDNIASAYIKSDGWIDFILLAKIDGEWKMMNVVWQKP